MFTLLDRKNDRNCQGVSRREFLRIGSLGLLGGSLSLPALLQSRAQAAAAGRMVKDKSVVLLFLQGGPSHIEFFDPKMTAPEEIRSITGEVQTTLPGITFGGSFHEAGPAGGPAGDRSLLCVRQRGPHLSHSCKRRQCAEGDHGEPLRTGCRHEPSGNRDAE